MSENALEKQIREELEIDGWAVLRNGLPDFVCVKDNELKFVEVKRNNDVLSDKQKEVIKHLRKNGFKVEVVTRNRMVPSRAKVFTECIQCGGNTRHNLKFNRFCSNRCYHDFFGQDFGAMKDRMKDLIPEPHHKLNGQFQRFNHIRYL